MVDNIIRSTSKKTWYKWSVYINVVLFFIVALFIYLLVKDSIAYGNDMSDAGLYIARDIAFLAVTLALIFYQFFRKLFVIMRRSL